MNTHAQLDLYGETQSAPEMLQARKIAVVLLDQVLTRRTPLDQVLDDNHEFSELPQRDRAFVRMMVATTLRRMGQIDDLIRHATERAEAPSPPLLHHILRLGVVQIMFMNVPDHAAVDTSVRLAESANLGRQKGFVNAVLRRMTREGKDWIAKQDEARINLPDWMLSAWVADYGLRQAAEIALASLTEAPLDITLKDPAHAEHWASVLEATILPTGSLRRNAGGNIMDLNGYREGMWWIQDAAAALPARLFGDLEGRHVIDVCAAPGGKTAQLAAAGAQVTALDRSVRRLQRLQENMERLRLEKQVHTEPADAVQWLPKAPVDAVLLDAPCSATGTIRRHPDVLHSKTPDDVSRLGALQAQLLDHAVHMLVSGGTLVYCTCSLQKAEGENQIESFIDRSGFRRAPISDAEIGNIAGVISPAGDARILPTCLAEQGGMDGFYIARLIKP